MAFIAPSLVDQNGTAMAFGFNSGYTPAALVSAGFLARAIASSDGEPEVFVTATNGEGEVEAVAISKVSRGKMLKVQLIGYITNAFDKSTLVNTCSGTGAGPLGSRFFFIKKVSDPVPKGAQVEVSIDLESYPGITS